MILLTEVADIEEFYRLRFLFESNGILIHSGNVDSARNFGFLHPVGKYAIHIMLEEQLPDAQKLLFDENHVVTNKVDIEQYRDDLEENKIDINNKILISISMVCFVLIILFGLLIF